MAQARILLVDDDSAMATVISEACGQALPSPYGVEWVRRCAEGLDRLSWERLHEPTRADPIAAVVVSLTLPDAVGLDGFRRLFRLAPEIPILVLANAEQEGLAKQAMQLGAQDYLLRSRIDHYALLKALSGVVDRSAATRALTKEKEGAQATLNSMGDAVISTDTLCRVTYLNAVAEALTGWPSHEAVGRPIGDVFQPLDALSRRPAQNAMALAIRENRTVFLPQNSVLVRRGGEVHAVEDSVSPIHDRDGKLTGAVLVFRDVSDARAVRDRVAYTAGHDSLTDLPNRALFYDRLAQGLALARRNGHPLAVMYLDVDGFKAVNDSFGHGVGDLLLKSVASRLGRCVRSSDTVGRQGGNEFLVLLSDVARARDAEVIAAKILCALAAPHRIAAHALNIGVSIGIASYPGDGADVETLINRADAAMYQAKSASGNRYHSYDSSLSGQVAPVHLPQWALRKAQGG